jgi:hypothetical protein
VNQKVKAIFKLRGNRDREQLTHAQYWQCLLKSSAICSTALCLQSSGSNEGENVDAPLQDCTIEDRGAVRFVWAEGAKHMEIHRRILAQYGQSAISKLKVYEWVERKRCAVADSLPMRKWRKRCTPGSESSRIQKLVEDITNVLCCEGDYVVKWHAILLTVTSIN